MSTPSDEPSSEAADGLTAEADDDATAVASDAAAPAPPRRSRRNPRRMVSSDPDPNATVVTSEAPPLVTEPVTEFEAEAVLVSEPFPFEEPRPRIEPVSVTTPEPLPASPASSGARQVRQTIQKVDLWAVTKLSLCFYVSAMFVTLIALIALWIIADAAGIIDSVEKFMNDILSAKDFKFLSASVLRGTILVGLVIVALQVVITVIAASFYNIFAELFGGVEITVKEEEI